LREENTGAHAGDQRAGRHDRNRRHRAAAATAGPGRGGAGSTTYGRQVGGRPTSSGSEVRRNTHGGRARSSRGP
jgi:hypothetical protein